MTIKEKIRAAQVRVIDSDGSQLGVMKTDKALELAYDKGLDLVEMNANAPVPIVKIMDYGKFKYEQKKRASEAKKNQKTTELKEVWIKPFIEENDLNIKLKDDETIYDEVSSYFGVREIKTKNGQNSIFS